LARLRAANGRYSDSVTLYQAAIAIVPMPVYVAELGDLYTKLGRKTDAEKQYKLVEYIGRLGEINQVLHNRDLAVFYADHDEKPAEAVALARKEFEVRHDIYTWDALAWTLYKDGQFDEAYKAGQHALNYGTRDSLLLYHAGLEAMSAGKEQQAEEELSAALAINPHFHLTYADSARTSLQTLANAEMAKIRASAGAQ
jgi:tetratricopeptide (TPR) repeat protein